MYVFIEHYPHLKCLINNLPTNSPMLWVCNFKQSIMFPNNMRFCCNLWIDDYTILIQDLKIADKIKSSCHFYKCTKLNYTYQIILFYKIYHLHSRSVKNLIVEIYFQLDFLSSSRYFYFYYYVVQARIVPLSHLIVNDDVADDAFRRWCFYG